MDNLIFKQEAVRVINGRKSHGLLTLMTDNLEFKEDSGLNILSINIPDLRKTEMTHGMVNSFFSKKHFIVLTLENDEHKFYIAEEFIEGVIGAYNAKKTEFNDPTKYSESIRKHSRTIYELILDNPYYILGLPFNSDYNEALEIKDKIEKYAKLKVSKAFSSPFDLKNIESPKRDLSAIQSSIIRCKESEYKWFWFEKADFTQIWEDPRIFDWVENRSFNYDLLLACYIQLLFTSPCFENCDLWSRFISQLDNLICIKDNQLWLILRDNNRVSVNDYLNQEFILTEFRNIIITPLDRILRAADEFDIMLFSKVMQRTTIRSNLLKELIQDALVNKATDRKRTVNQAIKNYSYVIDIHELYESFEDTIMLIEEITYVVKEVGSLTSIYYKRIWDIYINILGSVTDFFINQDMRSYGIYFAKKLYKLCNEDGQQKLRNYFGHDKLALSHNDLSVEEMYLIAIMYVDGDGVEKDEHMAFEWFLKAANAGYSDAMLAVATYYLEGKVVIRSEKYAEEYLLKASDKGNTKATDLLLLLQKKRTS